MPSSHQSHFQAPEYPEEFVEARNIPSVASLWARRSPGTIRKGSPGLLRGFGLVLDAGSGAGIRDGPVLVIEPGLQLLPRPEPF